MAQQYVLKIKSENIFLQDDKYRVLIQDGDIGRFWIHLPQKLNRQLHMEQFPPEKTPQSMWANQANKKKMTSRLVGEVETQSHHKPHPQEEDLQPGEHSNPELFPGGLRFEFEAERQTPKTSSSEDKRAHIPESHKARQTKNSSQRARRRRLPGSGPSALEDPTYCDKGSSAHLKASSRGGRHLT